MDVSRIVEGICLSTAVRSLIESYTEVTLPDRATRIRAVGEAALVGELVGIPSAGVSRNCLDPELEVRIPVIAEVVVERVPVDKLNHLLHGERVEWVKFAIFGVLK
jgi:hypothetical protein